MSSNTQFNSQNFSIIPNPPPLPPLDSKKIVSKQTQATETFDKLIREKADAFQQNIAQSLQGKKINISNSKAFSKIQNVSTSVTHAQIKPPIRERVSGASALFQGLKNQRTEMEHAVKISGKSEEVIISDILNNKKSWIKKSNPQTNSSPLDSFQTTRFNLSGKSPQDPDFNTYIPLMEKAIEERLDKAFGEIEKNKGALNSSALYSFKMIPAETGKEETIYLTSTPYINKNGEPDLAIRISLGYAGGGKFTSAYVSADIDSGETRILKVTQLPSLESNELDGKALKSLSLYDSADREIHFLSEMSKTQSAVKTYDVFHMNLYEKTASNVVKETPALGVIQDYFDMGEVSSLIGNSEDIMNDIVLQMINEVAILHGQGIVNRDIKPENFVAANSATHNFGIKIGMIDGGGAAFVEEKSDLRTGRHGTEAYMSPEQIKNFLIARGYIEGDQSELERSTDVYSLGMSMYYLLHSDQSESFPPGTEAWIKICQDGIANSSATKILAAYYELQQLPKPPVSEAKDYLIWQMMHPNPSMRPTIEEVKQRFKALI